MIQHSPQLGQFFVAGINYKKSDASLRSEFALMPDAYVQLLRAAPDYGIEACFVISTCNRTEIYGMAAEASQLSQLLCAFTPGNQHTFQLISYTHQGADAANHLFRVAAGLDSQILGDYEIVGQLKQAIATARTEARLDAFTDRLVNEVLQCGKAIRTHTQLSGGTVSVAFAAIQYLKAEMQARQPRIAIIGTGKMGRNTCKNLIDYTGYRNIVVLNRSAETAEKLAAELQVNQLPFTALEQAVAGADVVIVSTAASEPILHADMVNDGRERILIDLSVPNNVAVDTALLPNVKLVNVDKLSQQKDATLELRKKEVPKAETLINTHLSAFLQWVHQRRYIPVLNAAREKMLALQNCPVWQGPLGSADQPVDPKGIQRIIKHMAVEMQAQPEPGCNYLNAINRFIHQRFTPTDAPNY